MKGFLFWLSIGIGVVLLVTPIGYSVVNRTAEGLVDNLMGNWAATMIGAIVGIPIALAISRWQQTEQESKELKAQDKERLERKNKILDLLRAELAENQTEIKKAVEAHQTRPWETRLPGCKDVMWHALSDGGELHWLDNLKLLSMIASAYFYIGTLIKLDEQFADLLSTVPNLNPLDVKKLPMGISLLNGKEMMRPYALDWIEGSLKEIDEHLLTLRGTNSEG